MTGKNPAFLFYPSDWQRDLEEHPLEIEGAWIRICCKLWWSETRGEMTKPLEQWARILRENRKKTEKILNYLSKNGVASITFLDNQNITIISRRMVKDEKLREIRREVGKLGGNPKLKISSNVLLNQNNNQNNQSSVSVSVSVSDSKNKYSENSDEVRLSELLLKNILEHNPGFKKPNIQKWAVNIDRLIRIDNRTVIEIEKVIDWCQNNTFWQSNILSTDKLRHHYDKLNTKRLSINNYPTQPTKADSFDELLDRMK